MRFIRGFFILAGLTLIAIGWMLPPYESSARNEGAHPPRAPMPRTHRHRHAADSTATATRHGES
jgi:hypothetical protein